MRALLNTIKQTLQSGLSDIRDVDIYITPDINYIPGSVRVPCIGIKDGSIRRTEIPCGMFEKTLHADIVIYVQILKDEAGIVGIEATGQKGILEIADDVHEILDENLLSIDGMIAAYSPFEEPLEMFGDKRNAVLRKVITYEYVKEEVRP